MKNLQNLLNPRNRKALFVVLTLASLAIAGGAPGAGSGIGGGVSLMSVFGF